MKRPIVIVAWLLIALVVLAAAVVGAGTWAWRDLNQPLALPDDGELFEVPRGASLGSVSQSLHERAILSSPRILTWYARIRGDATRIRAGEYLLRPGLTSLTLLDKLIRGDVFLHQFTIVEGLRFEEVLRQLRMHPAIAVGDATPAEIMAALGEPDLHPEGQFLPDTYVFPRGTEDVSVLGWAHEELEAVLAEAWQGRTEDVAVGDAYELLILASIVEKETALASERRRIAGVFHARLRRNMRLQTDPTVIYGLGDEYDGNLRRRDLARDTPYNTYTRAGLPPTPIALAGREAIAAAAQPILDGALYFVATGDPDGSHRFSTTLEEHNEAVAAYLRRLRELR